MALSSDVKQILIDKKVKEYDFAVKSKVQVAEDKKIGKILSVESKVAVKNMENKENLLLVSGNIYLDVLYLSKDNNFEKANAVVEYTSSIEGAFKNPFVTCEIVDTRVDVENDELTINFDNAIKAKVYNRFVENIVTPETSEDLYIKTEQCELNTVADRRSELFTLVDEVKLSDNLNQVLNIDTMCNVKSIQKQGDILVVEFDMLKDITYLVDDNQVKTERKSQTLKQEFSITSDEDIYGEIDVKSQKASIEVEEEKSSTSLSIVYILEFKFVCVKSEIFDLAVDAYSTTKELLLSKECFMIENFQEYHNKNEKLTLSVNTKNDIQEVLSIKNISCFVTSNTKIGENLHIEGVVCFDTIYKDANLNKVLTQKMSVPYAVDLQVGTFTNCDISPYFRVLGIKTKGSNGLDILFDCNFNITTFGEENICYVSAIDIKGEKEETLAPISIYKCMDEDDFDVAKGLNISPDELKEFKSDDNASFVTIFREIK